MRHDDGTFSSRADDDTKVHLAYRPLLVRIEQAAEMLSVSRTTLYQLMWRGELTPVRIGRSVRFSIAQLEEFVRRAASPRT